MLLLQTVAMGLQQTFEVNARFFVYMNAVTPVTCADATLMNLVF